MYASSIINAFPTVAASIALVLLSDSPRALPTNGDVEKEVIYAILDSHIPSVFLFNELLQHLLKLTIRVVCKLYLVRYAAIETRIVLKEFLHLLVVTGEDEDDFADVVFRLRQ
jgi:hypothetical protein